VISQAEENQKRADRLYELKMRELDQRACELQFAEEACRKAVLQATKDFNLAQVKLAYFHLPFLD
jgi:RIB43A